MSHHPSTMFVRPAPGLVLRDPISGETLPEAGRVVPRSGFWLRRRNDGDVIEGKPEAAVQAAPAKTEAEAQTAPAKKGGKS